MLYILFLTITVDVTECLLPKLKPKDEKCVAKDWLHAELQNRSDVLGVGTARNAICNF